MSVAPTLAFDASEVASVAPAPDEALSGRSRAPRRIGLAALGLTVLGLLTVSAAFLLGPDPGRLEVEPSDVESGEVETSGAVIIGDAGTRATTTETAAGGYDPTPLTDSPPLHDSPTPPDSPPQPARSNAGSRGKRPRPLGRPALDRDNPFR